jgi:hypothetical protein
MISDHYWIFLFLDNIKLKILKLSFLLLKLKDWIIIQHISVELDKILQYWCWGWIKGYKVGCCMGILLSSSAILI